jgi:uncharacterized protein YjlB
MMVEKVKEYLFKDDGIFPNSKLPVLHYLKVLKLPFLFRASHVRHLFRSNGWTNNWRNGIYTYQHYHSITHEAMGVIKGKTTLLLGGDHGEEVAIEEGDVIIIPAGVAHKNLGRQDDVICIGGYPKGRDFDMNYGRPGERPRTDKNIANLPLPKSDPVYGPAGLVIMWPR